jgi:hypothetical protein
MLRGGSLWSTEGRGGVRPSGEWRLPERNPLRNNTLFCECCKRLPKHELLRSRPFRSRNRRKSVTNHKTWRSCNAVNSASESEEAENALFPVNTRERSAPPGTGAFGGHSRQPHLLTGVGYCKSLCEGNAADLRILREQQHLLLEATAMFVKEADHTLNV